MTCPHPVAIERLPLARPPVRNFTVAGFVFLTTVLPFEPARFFFLAVAALWLLLSDCALLLGKHLSGFFLSLDVPHLPLILPSVPIRTQSWFTHFLRSPRTSYLLIPSHSSDLCNTWMPPCSRMQKDMYQRCVSPTLYL